MSNNAETYESSDNLSRELFRQKIIKGVIIIINIILIIFGAVICFLGSSAKNSSVAQISSETMPSGIITIGILILFLSLFGILSAWFEWRKALKVYLVFVLFMIIILIGVASVIYVNKDQAPMDMSKGWTNASNDVRVSLEGEFNCCGIRVFNDSWAGQPCPSSSRAFEGVPCLNLISDQYQAPLNIASGVFIALAVFMIFSLFFMGFSMIKRNDKGTEEAEDNNRFVSLSSSQPGAQAPLTILSGSGVSQPTVSANTYY